jgi:sulfotransferase
MHKTYFFLSGLPRTGGSLLGAILDQNPDIYVGPTSPVLTFCANTDLLFQSLIYRSFPKEDFKFRMLSRICDDWYSDIDSPIVIDKSRGWSGCPRFAGLFTNNVKIICTVRSILEILSSWILLIRKSPDSFIDRHLKKLPISALTDDNRCDYLMEKEHGTIDQSLSSLKEGFKIQNFNHTNFLHLVEYDDLINDTENIINGIYNFLELPTYKHQYDNIKNITRENDMLLGMPEMHDVRSTISRSNNNPLEILSDNIIKKYSGLEFWREK